MFAPVALALCSSVWVHLCSCSAATCCWQDMQHKQRSFCRDSWICHSCETEVLDSDLISCEKFSLSRCLQLREALLEEIRLAALTLRESAKFSVGLASAISAHIHASLISNANLPGSRQFANQSMHLEHARLLEVEPLRALLSFLWIQLGLRWEILPCNQKAAELSLVSIHCSSPKLASFKPVVVYFLCFIASARRHHLTDQKEVTNVLVRRSMTDSYVSLHTVLTSYSKLYSRVTC